jgi:hypothetical protein
LIDLSEALAKKLVTIGKLITVFGDYQRKAEGRIGCVEENLFYFFSDNPMLDGSLPQDDENVDKFYASGYEYSYAFPIDGRSGWYIDVDKKSQKDVVNYIKIGGKEI